MDSDLSQLPVVFDDYLSMQTQQEWEVAKTTLQCGVEVSGKVVARAPFGIFLDIGAGFPALIRVVDLRNADVTAYTSMEMYPAVGSQATGIIIGFNDRNRQIELTQQERTRIASQS